MVCSTPVQPSTPTHMKSTIVQPPAPMKAYSTKSCTTTVNDPMDIEVNTYRTHQQFRLRYEVYDRIHNSLYGGVYQAFDTLTKTWVAIKISNLELMRRGVSVSGHHVNESVLDEVATLRKLSGLSRNLMTILDESYGTISHYMVLPLGGNELFDYVTQGQMHRFDVPKLFAELAQSVNLMHNNLNIPHRDLSIENVLMSVDETHFILCDFGLATEFEKGETTTDICGKPSYVAPEIYEGVPYDPFKADIFALGVILFCLVYGCTPFRKAVRSDPLYELVRQDRLSTIIDTWGFSSKISPSGVHLIQQMLRPANMRISLDEVLNHPFLYSLSP